MFNILISGSAWNEESDYMPRDRVFEHTNQDIKDIYAINNQINFEKLKLLPTLLMQESRVAENQYARFVIITNIRINNKKVELSYEQDTAIPQISNIIIEKNALKLDIDNYEFSRTHWAVKEPDIYKILLPHFISCINKPEVFSVSEYKNIDNDLISVMMPFSGAFTNVYNKIKSIADSINMRCTKADEIWNNHSIIQDVVSLIDKSKIVICDCTGKNPNVFYEMGIAHTLGRNVIFITQLENDIPFDLRHLRYIHYLNNKEGLESMGEKLKDRINDLKRR